ncbi:glycerol-3-phosphate 1-O-acyltransferase PlsY [Clostridium sp.]|uniref:glycerol-3-phosphate 1-O-acyltransferase PlsY n=1 Tax=Clostridium sp. TaxID=1506 RepID=UPI002FC8686B
MLEICTIMTAYLIGSIPFGYLIIKKYKGIDIRNVGSGNIGATNVKRVAGRKLSLIVQTLDMLKGFLPVFISSILYEYVNYDFNKDLLLSAVCVATILGHNFTIFLNFKGGKGVATTVGATIYILPFPTLCGVISYGILKLLTKIVSVKSMTLSFVLFITTFILNYSIEFKFLSFLALTLILIRHKENIKRLLNGTEK